MTQIQGATKFS